MFVAHFQGAICRFELPGDSLVALAAPQALMFGVVGDTERRSFDYSVIAWQIALFIILIAGCSQDISHYSLVLLSGAWVEPLVICSVG